MNDYRPITHRLNIYCAAVMSRRGGGKMGGAAIRV